MTLSVAGIA